MVALKSLQYCSDSSERRGTAEFTGNQHFRSSNHDCRIAVVVGKRLRMSKIMRSLPSELRLRMQQSLVKSRKLR